MRKAISELIIKLEKDKDCAMRQKENALCELDEGFFNGVQTAYKYVIGTLEYILTKKEA